MRAAVAVEVVGVGRVGGGLVGWGCRMRVVVVGKLAGVGRRIGLVGAGCMRVVVGGDRAFVAVTGQEAVVVVVFVAVAVVPFARPASRRLSYLLSPGAAELGRWRS